jgi:hypothetical protein
MRVGHDVPFRLSPDREVRRAWSREFAIGSSRRGRAVTDHWRVARFHRLPGAVARVGCRKSGHARGPGSRSACALPDHLRRPARVGQPSRGARGSGPCSGPGRMPGPGVHGLDAVAEPVRTLGSRARVQHVGELSGARPAWASVAGPDVSGRLSLWKSRLPHAGPHSRGGYADRPLTRHADRAQSILVLLAANCPARGHHINGA